MLHSALKAKNIVKHDDYFVRATSSLNYCKLIGN